MPAWFIALTVVAVIGLLGSLALADLQVELIQSGHVACSTRRWALIPREGGQLFHGIVGRFDRQSNGIGFFW